MDTLEAMKENLMKGQVPKVKELIQTALDEGAGVEEILNKGLIAPMSIIGEKFKKEEIYLPEVLFAARAMLAGMDVLEPLMAGAGVEPIAKVVLGTVKGDIHSIGKNLVGIMMKGAGFEVTDLGIDVPPEKFVDAAQEGAKLIGISALTSTTAAAPFNSGPRQQWRGNASRNALPAPRLRDPGQVCGTCTRLEDRVRARGRGAGAAQRDGPARHGPAHLGTEPKRRAPHQAGG